MYVLWLCTLKDILNRFDAQIKNVKYLCFFLISIKPPGFGYTEKLLLYSSEVAIMGS